MSSPLKKLHITKAEINELPLRQYEGEIVLCKTPEEARDAALKLQKETLLGFDTETRPAFRRGEHYDPSLLQLAGENAVYLFQIQQTGLIPELLSVLSDRNILKAGVAIDRDITELEAMAEFDPQGFVELAGYAERNRIKNLGLRGMAALLLGFRISKREQVSNWAKPDLSPSQIVYAATDAWLGREIYLFFQRHGMIGY
jgi:ribonuclease D